MIQVARGDVFCTRGDAWLSRAIRFVTKMFSKDNDVKYNHSGIIINPAGDTIEALNSGVKSQNLFQAYRGKQVIIARPMVSHIQIQAALVSITDEHYGHIYPWWRIAMYIFGPLAKIGITERLVCSELAAKYLHELGIRHDQYRGTSPDDLADEFVHWKEYQVVYEGIINTR